MRLDTDALHRSLATLCAEHVVPGAAIAIVHGDDELTLCHGVTDVDDPNEVDANTLFALMSDTKPFTAYAAVALAEQGVLDLDARAKSYVPDLKLQDPDAERDVTARHLLQHSPDWTGDHFRDFEGPDAMTQYVATLADVMQLAPVGTFPAYVNSGYTLLGYLLTRATGRPFADLLHEHVLSPHGLRATTFLPERPTDVKVAAGHGVADGVALVNEWDTDESDLPSGGLWSTANDQLAWLRVQAGDSTVVRRMRDERVEWNGPTISHVGLGWFRLAGYPIDVYRHGGGGLGHQSAVFVVPEHRFACAILTNGFHGNHVHGPIGVRILKDALDLDAPPPPVLIDLEASDLEDYAGSYTSGAMDCDIRVGDSGIVLQSRFEWTDFVPDPLPLRFYARDRTWPGEFFRDDSGDVRWFRWMNRLTVKR